MSTPAPTREQFARDLLARLELPVTTPNLRALLAWMGAENTRARFNPFATTMDAPGATRFNSVGVRNFRDWWQGIDATARTLQLGYYERIRAELRRGESAGAVLRAVAASPWGTGKLGLRVLPQVRDDYDRFAGVIVPGAARSDPGDLYRDPPIPEGGSELPGAGVVEGVGKVAKGAVDLLNPASWLESLGGFVVRAGVTILFGVVAIALVVLAVFLFARPTTSEG